MDELVRSQESVVEPDSMNHFVVLFENHTGAPVTLNRGDVLGILQEIHFPSDERTQPSDNLGTTEDGMQQSFSRWLG